MAVVQKGKFTLKKGGAKATNSLIEELKAKKGASRSEGAGGAEGTVEAGEPEKPAVPIEEEVLALFESVPEAKNLHFRRFWIELAHKLWLPSTSLAILEAFSNIDVTADRVAKSLERNSYYGNIFRKFIELMGKREETPSLEAAVILLGMTNSRNLILALQMERALKGGHPEWKVVPPSKDPILQLRPTERLKFALRTEEELMKDKAVYSDTAFAASMLFDWLTLLAEVEGRKDVIAYVQQVHNHSIKAAKIGAKLAEGVPDLSGGKWVFSACLLHDVGKIVMALIDPKYIRFMEACQRKGMHRELRFFAERERYGIDHALMGSLTCRLFRVFEPIAPAVRHHHRPYLLKHQPGGLYPLAQLVALATNIATVSKKPEKPTDPILAQWFGLEITDLKIPFEVLQTASSAGG